MQPRRFGRYELLHEMGKGGMATIHLARLVGPSDFQKHLVLKTIHPRLTKDAEVVNRFLDEARLAARILHPNVVQITEFDRLEGTYYIAMEYVHGNDLSQLYGAVQKNPACGYQWGHPVRIIAEAAAGLHAAHELKGADGGSLNLVHRDVSPHNILVSYAGHVKVTDFGIAHAVGRLHHTMDGTVMGKVAYMSPEQCRGEELDRRSDVFALGIVLYEMVCLRRLFRRDSDQDTLLAVVEGQVPSPRQLQPQLPVDLEQILMRCLAPLPRDRYQTAAEVQYALEGLLAKERVLVNSGSLSALMGVAFQEEKNRRDRQIQSAYNRTFMEAPKRDADTLSLGPAVAAEDTWDSAAAPTTRDLAPPAVHTGSASNETMRGFRAPGNEQAPVSGDIDVSAFQETAPEVKEGTLRGFGAAPSSGGNIPHDGSPVMVASDSASLSIDTLPMRAPRESVVTAAETPAGIKAAPKPVSFHTGKGGGVEQRPHPADFVTLELDPVRRRRPLVWILAAVGVVALIVAIVALAGHLGVADKTSGTKQAAGGRQGEQVTFTIDVTPPDAKVVVGGTEIQAASGSPTRVVQLKRDETPVWVRVSAAGHTTSEQAIRPDQDRKLTIRLLPAADDREPTETAMRPRPRPRAHPRRRRGSSGRGRRRPSSMRVGEDVKDPFGEGLPSRPYPRRRSGAGSPVPGVHDF
ncbi:MAG: serine/threonine-protein kinase [bacterium]